MLPGALLSGAARRHIILDGDSIMSGGVYVPADTTGTDLMTMLRVPCSHKNVALGGTGAETCPHTGWNTGAPVPASSWIYLCDAGINNLNAGSPSLATIQGYIDAWIAVVNAVNPRAIVMQTVIASTAHDTVDGRLSDRLALNDWIRAKDGTGRIHVADPAADAYFQLSNVAAYAEGDGTGDGDTHPGTNGTHYLMTFAAAVINGLL